MIQEVLTLVVFGVFVIAYMGEPLRWNHLVSFAFLVAAVYFVFGFGPPPTTAPDVSDAEFAESTEPHPPKITNDPRT